MSLAINPQIASLSSFSHGHVHLPITGITNYDEYSLVRDIGEEKKEETTGTLKKDKTLLRDDKKMEKLKQKLHTDDERKCMEIPGADGSCEGEGSVVSKSSVQITWLMR